MSDEELAHQADAEHVRFELAQGLEACRVMVANYRLMLVGAANDNAADQPAMADHAEEA